MSTTYTPGNGVPLPEQQKPGGGCLKWGGIGAGLLILFGLAGSCGGSDAETVVKTETVTVTTGASASTVTTTATVTANGAASAEPSSAAQQPAEQSAGDTGAAADAPEEPEQQRAQFLAPAPAPEQPAPAQSAYYPNCAAARSAGAAPLYAGDPGYSSKLDRDGDGVACE